MNYKQTEIFWKLLKKYLEYNWTKEIIENNIKDILNNINYNNIRNIKNNINNENKIYSEITKIIKKEIFENYNNEKIIIIFYNNEEFYKI
jgi:hypothetical protein